MLTPGDSRTIYISGAEMPNASMPVFKICAASAGLNELTLHVRVPDKGKAYERNEVIPAGNCVFASGRSLAVSVAGAPETGTAETEENAAAWLDERVKALRAKEDRTDEEEGMLAKFQKALNQQRTIVNVFLMTP